jgi:hypothetical protein
VTAPLQVTCVEHKLSSFLDSRKPYVLYSGFSAAKETLQLGRFGIAWWAPARPVIMRATSPGKDSDG